MKLNARIDRMVQKGNIKAIASVSLEGMFVVKGLKVMDGKKGLFVSMPQEYYPGKNGQKQYSNTFFALTNSAKMQLQKVVLDAYKLSLDQNYEPKQSQGQHDYPQHVQYQLDYYGGQYHQQYPEPGYGFETERLGKDQIKRILGIYFGATMDGDKLPDVDGGQYEQEAKDGTV